MKRIAGIFVGAAIGAAFGIFSFQGIGLVFGISSGVLSSTAAVRSTTRRKAVLTGAVTGSCVNLLLLIAFDAFGMITQSSFDLFLEHIVWLLSGATIGALSGLASWSIPAWYAWFIAPAIFGLFLLGESYYQRNATTFFPLSSLLRAAGFSNRQTIELLLWKGAEMSDASWFGYTPMHWAAGFGDTNLFMLLIQSRTRDTLNRFGNSSLHFAAGRNRKEIVQMLLAEGWDADVKNQFDDTPLDLAAGNNYKEVAAMLGESGRKQLPHLSEQITIRQEQQTQRTREEPERQTMKFMKAFGAAITGYAFDRFLPVYLTQDEEAELILFPPDANAATLKGLLEPSYIRKLPTSDAWGTPLLVTIDEGSFRIVSAGADGNFGSANQDDLIFSAILLEEGKFVNRKNLPQQPPRHLSDLELAELSQYLSDKPSDLPGAEVSAGTLILLEYENEKEIIQSKLREEISRNPQSARAHFLLALLSFQKELDEAAKLHPVYEKLLKFRESFHLF